MEDIMKTVDRPTDEPVTSISQAEKALHAEQHRFQTLTENIPLGIALIDKNGSYTYINSIFTEMFGYDLSDVPNGRAWFLKAYPDPSYRKKVISTWLSDFEYFRPGEQKPWIFRVTCKDGAVKNIHFLSIQLETGEILVTYEDFTQLITTREALAVRELELELKTKSLEEANTALRVLLKLRGEDKKELEEMFIANIRELVLPYLEKMKKGRLETHQTAYLNIIEENLNDIMSPFLQKMMIQYANFTPTEIQVANLIKAGKTSKEIADLLNVSPGTVDTHRNNVREKLGLNNRKINLRTYLLSLA